MEDAGLPLGKAETTKLTAVEGASGSYEKESVSTYRDTKAGKKLQ